MERNSSVTLQQILARLSDILALKQTGTFFIATDMNTSCRFAIESGKLTHCTHRRDQGMDAVHSLLEIGGGSCSFSENQTIPFRSDAVIDHPMTLTILDIHPQPPAPVPLQPAKAESAPAPRQSAPSPVVSRYYRGQGFGSSPSTPTPPEEPRYAAPVAEPAKKRFYRGGLSS